MKIILYMTYDEGSYGVYYFILLTFTWQSYVCQTSPVFIRLTSDYVVHLKASIVIFKCFTKLFTLYSRYNLFYTSSI